MGFWPQPHRDKPEHGRLPLSLSASSRAGLPHRPCTVLQALFPAQVPPAGHPGPSDLESSLQKLSSCKYSNNHIYLLNLRLYDKFKEKLIITFTAVRSLRNT